MAKIFQLVSSLSISTILIPYFTWYWRCQWGSWNPSGKLASWQGTGSSHPSESLRSKMASNDWTKTQVFTKLIRSDGHLKIATFWLYDCPCEMELSNSFQSKMSKFQCLSHFFFSKEPGNRFVVVCASEKGEESGARIKQQWDSWKCQESWFGLCFCNLKPFAAFWMIPDQCL